MAIGRFFKSLVNSEVMGEEIVKSIIHLYEQTARYNPGDGTHDLLLKTYLARLKVRRINIDDERVVLNALADIQLPAQLPEGKSIKALALYCLFKERPDIINAYPKFAAEYDRLMVPILENSRFCDGKIDPLESSYEQTSSVPEEEVNKNNFVCPSCGFKSKVPLGKAGVVTCPNCQLKTSVTKNGNIQPYAVRDIQASTPKDDISAKEVDKEFYNKAADLYAKQKEENRRKQPLDNRLEKHAEIIPEPRKTATGISIEWLRDNAQYFERKKAKGIEISDYEQRLIDQYKEALIEDSSDQIGYDEKSN